MVTERMTVRRSDLPWEPKMRLAHLGVESAYDDGVQTREEFTITDTGVEYIIISGDQGRVICIAHPLLEALIAFHQEAHPAVEAE